MSAEPEEIFLPAQLPPLPEHQIEVWERLCKRMTDCKSRAGVYLLLCGWSYRAAGQAIGISGTGLHDTVTNYGLRDAVNRTDRAIQNHRTVEIMATEALIEKGSNGELINESARDLAVVAGVSRDKVRDWEKQQEGSMDALTTLERIARGLAETGMRLDLSLTPAGRDSGAEAVEDYEPVTDVLEPRTLPPE